MKTNSRIRRRERERVQMSITGLAFIAILMSRHACHVIVHAYVYYQHYWLAKYVEDPPRNFYLKKREKNDAYLGEINTLTVFLHEIHQLRFVFQLIMMIIVEDVIRNHYNEISEFQFGF